MNAWNLPALAVGEVQELIGVEIESVAGLSVLGCRPITRPIERRECRLCRLVFGGARCKTARQVSDCELIFPGETESEKESVHK